MVRTPSRDKNGLKKGTWTQEEDRKLTAYISRYGCWNWRQLPKYAGLSRCGKSCRLRWLNYLRPDIKRGNYTKEEEDIILKFHKSLGNRWSAIAAHLPGRTDNEIKNYWHTNLKKRSKQNHVTYQENPNSKTPSKREITILEKGTQPNYNNLVNVATPQIVESSPLLSSQPSSSSELSSTTTDTNMFVEDNVVSLEAYVEGIGNFWTEPFLSDSCYNSYMPSDFLVDDPDFFLASSPGFDVELFYQYGLNELPE